MLVVFKLVRLLERLRDKTKRSSIVRSQYWGGEGEGGRRGSGKEDEEVYKL